MLLLGCMPATPAVTLLLLGCKYTVLTLPPLLLMPTAAGVAVAPHTTVEPAGILLLLGIALPCVEASGTAFPVVPATVVLLTVLPATVVLLTVLLDEG
jgi:hypothetical protein